MHMHMPVQIATSNEDDLIAFVLPSLTDPIVTELIGLAGTTTSAADPLGGLTASACEAVKQLKQDNVEWAATVAEFRMSTLELDLT